MTGDQQDIAHRLYEDLPSGWFPDLGGAPALAALLNGIAYGFARIYALLAFIRLQTRLVTASGIWLDGIAFDYFGYALVRRTGQSDALLRQRIKAQLIQPKGTRAGMIAVLTTLTGRAPQIIVAANPTDCGGYTIGGAGYGTAGAWGDLSLPCQAFITAYRPQSGGIPAVAGYTTGGAGYGTVLTGGAYSTFGASEYGNAVLETGNVSDADILSAISAVMPVGAIAWTRITS